jgi:hypothetical protein
LITRSSFWGVERSLGEATTVHDSLKNVSVRIFIADVPQKSTDIEPNIEKSLLEAARLVPKRASRYQLPSSTIIAIKKVPIEKGSDEASTAISKSPDVLGAVSEQKPSPDVFWGSFGSVLRPRVHVASSGGMLQAQDEHESEKKVTAEWKLGD